MTQQTITALFDTYAEAAEAVSRLEAAGIKRDAIAIMSNDAAHRDRLTDPPREVLPVESARDHNAGTGIGASLGTMVGGGAGLLAGLGMLAIPGLGPVVAAGWLVSAAVGAGIGAAAGGIVGALTGAGVSETDAQAYAEGLRRGGTLVTVQAEDTMAAQISDILERDGTIDMKERATAWRGEGWTGFITEPIVDERVERGEILPRDAIAASQHDALRPRPGADALLVDPAERGPRLTDQELRDGRARAYPADSQI